MQEGQQFDIRGTVDEFKQDVSMYSYWRPGMDIYVFHVRRKQIPGYVFPEGYKRQRPSRNPTQCTTIPEKDAKCCKSPEDRHPKRKHENETVDVNSNRLGKRTSVSPQRIGSVSPASAGLSPTSVCKESKVEHLSTGDVASSVPGSLNGQCKKSGQWECAESVLVSSSKIHLSCEVSS